MPTIQFNGVSYSVDQHVILKDITASFQDKSITTLVGPSGSGKTTILKLCNGLISATNGNIYIDGREITSFAPNLLRKTCGIVLQNAPIIRGTVYDNLALPRKLHKESFTKEEAIQLLAQVNLDVRFLFHDASELSGGQKQKLAIARTLVNRPSVLLLDEITSALDPTSTYEIEQLVQQLNNELHVTIIWITHDMAQAQAISDDTWILHGGELQASGDASLLNDFSDQLIHGGRL